MTPTAIYCRISKDRVGAGLGVERQEGDCRALAERLGLEVAEVLVDNDVSASGRRPRPAYQQLLADARAGRIAAILAWHTDRLHRQPAELEEYISVTRDLPTHTVKAGPLDLATPSGRMVARQLGAVARYEVEHAAERQQAAKQQAASAGKWSGGVRPYGYKSDGVTVRPAEAAVVAEMTEAVLNGSSIRALCAQLNDRGVPSSTGKPWNSSKLRAVLKRPRNAGIRAHQGKEVGPAAWPAIVDEAKWRAVVAMLADPARRTTPGSVPKWLLSGIAVCGVCGGPLRACSPGSAKSAPTAYSCEHKHVVRSAAEVDQLVSGVIVARLSRPDAIDLLRPRAANVDVGALKAESVNLSKRLDDLADNLDLDERTLTRRASKLRERLVEVEQKMAAAGRGSVLAGVVDAPKVEAAWAALDLDRRRAIVAELMTITVHRTGKGRPRGWTPGASYFDPRSVEIKPKD